MAREIERKFLVKSDFKPFAVNKIRIKQGYLSSLSSRSVRLRTYGDKAYITIKGAVSESGLSRYEWEKELPVSEAQDLMKLCEPGFIDKTRYLIKAGKHTFEVDEFYGDNKGLVIAEVELDSEDEEYIVPEWLGKEVTGDTKYSNSNLIKNPFRNWKH